MKLGAVFSLGVMAMSLFAGCEKTSAPAPAAGAGGRAPFTPTRAQPKLPTLKLWLGAHEITAEIARRSEEILTGMMFRHALGENEGMLFVFASPHRASFWMKNVSIPLSCAYIDPEGIIQEIHDLKPFDENPVPASTDKVQYVLEVNQGWFERHNVGRGMLVRTERGSLAETFFRQR